MCVIHNKISVLYKRALPICSPEYRKWILIRESLPTAVSPVSENLMFANREMLYVLRNTWHDPASVIR